MIRSAILYSSYFYTKPEVSRATVAPGRIYFSSSFSKHPDLFRTSAIGNDRTLSDRWIKASVAGTLWAASEIVFGSFLHNLRVPFTGNILTAIGLIILISVSFKWREKGLFWRAALICALMKTLSPSAVIFGPMIAIVSEGLLLEASTRILGRNWAGYLLGSMLAMSWNLFQKIVNYIIFYGFNIVEIYRDLVRVAEKQLDLQFDAVWLPVIILLLLYALFGTVAAITGIMTGKKLLKDPFAGNSRPETMPETPSQTSKPQPFSYSLVWLAMDFTLMAGSLSLIAFTAWYIWSPAITAITVIWSLRYRRALRQISKPGFWIFFAAITMITAWLVTSVRPGGATLAEGILAGIRMNFRAMVMILGFSVLGTELYNPVIRNFFMKTSLRQLPLALELSFESLPAVIANIPGFRNILKNPVTILHSVISGSEQRLADLKARMEQQKQVFIVCGKVSEGKTKTLEQLAGLLKVNNIASGGILAPRIVEYNDTAGYDIVDISSGVRTPFLRTGKNSGYERIGRFGILPAGLDAGKEALSLSAVKGKKVVLLDEAGRLELEGKGWAAAIETLLQSSSCYLVLSVRDELWDAVSKKWNLSAARVFKLAENSPRTIAEEILAAIKKIYCTQSNFR